MTAEYLQEQRRPGSEKLYLSLMFDQIQQRLVYLGIQTEHAEHLMDIAKREFKPKTHVAIHVEAGIATVTVTNTGRENASFNYSDDEAEPFGILVCIN